MFGVPPVVQWVKNVAAEAQVAAEAPVGSPACGVKDLALPQMQCSLQLQL